MSDSLRPHEPQHPKPPCPSPTSGVYSNSCSLSQWCHPTISSSVVPFSSCPQSFPASESFPMSQFFAWGGHTTGVQLQHHSFQRNPRADLLQNGLVGSPCSPRDSQEWRPKYAFHVSPADWKATHMFRETQEGPGKCKSHRQFTADLRTAWTLNALLTPLTEPSEKGKNVLGPSYLNTISARIIGWLLSYVDTEFPLGSQARNKNKNKNTEQRHQLLYTERKTDCAG